MELFTIRRELLVFFDEMSRVLFISRVLLQGYELLRLGARY
jgi:hypothetical protein